MHSSPDIFLKICEIPVGVNAFDSGKPPAASVICERQTPENIWTQYSGHFPQFVSETNSSCLKHKNEYSVCKLQKKFLALKNVVHFLEHGWT